MWAAMAAHVALVTYWRGHATKLAPDMKKLRLSISPAVLLLIGFSTLGQAHSLPGIEGSGSSSPERRGALASMHDGISLDEAVSRAERQYRARVVRTDVQDEDGRTVYVLKLLSEDGRVFTVRIDAATGRMR
jgi:hypothetical protein